MRQQAFRAEPVGGLNCNRSHFRRRVEDYMEKKIAQYSYWLGVACVVVALVWRAVNSMGYFPNANVPGVGIYYMSFYKGGLIFLLVCIATRAYSAAAKE